MGAKVIDFRTREGVGAGVHLDADTLLEANRGEFETLVLLGYNADGDLILASTDGPADTLWAMESAKLFLLSGCEEAEG